MESSRAHFLFLYPRDDVSALIHVSCPQRSKVPRESDLRSTPKPRITLTHTFSVFVQSQA